MTATLPESNPRSVRRPVPRRYREASRRARRRRVPSAPRLPVPLAAVAAAGWAVGVTLLACAAVTVLAWTAGGHGDAGFDDALRAGGLAYLVANLAPVTLPAGTFSLLPLGLTAVPLLLTHRAGRWAVRRTGCSTPAVVARLTVAAVLLYAAATAVVAATVDLGGVHVNPVLAFLTAASVALVGLGSGTVTAAGLWRPLGARVPVPLRRAGVAAAASTAALGAGAALLLALALALRVGHVRDLATQVAPGVSGAVVLALLGVLYLPTLVVWALAYAAGPGFVLGGAVTGPFDAGGGLAP
ncbi:MAG TPA: DUF6350 family protein, partial [Candidatus Nanopelagicales bacterium]|nr:DUF6350 family protein [Candidatus Nanopelagicales bacterium]